MALGDQNSCDCCSGIDAETPVLIHNRPGQTAIHYRVGTHSAFKESLLTNLSSEENPALQALGTRDDNDFTIAYIDAVATVLDVISFYQERFINEHYLNTAQERRSVLEMAKLIGYQLAPGVVASTHLAFSVQETPGVASAASKPVIIPQGTSVQSVPGQDEQAQIFETVASIEARAQWNCVKVQRTIPWSPRPSDRDIYIEGIDNTIGVGDTVLFVAQSRFNNANSSHWELRVISAVQTDRETLKTRLRWHTPLVETGHLLNVAEQSVSLYVFRSRASLFGHNAPDPRLMTVNNTGLFDLVDIDHCKVIGWKDFKNSNNQIDISPPLKKVLVGSWIALISDDDSEASRSFSSFTQLLQVGSVSELSRTDYALSAKVTRVIPDNTNNLEDFDLQKTLVLAESEPLIIASRPLFYPVYGSTLDLDSHYPELLPGKKFTISGRLQKIKIADGITGLYLHLHDKGSIEKTDTFESIKNQLLNKTLNKTPNKTFNKTKAEPLSKIKNTVKQTASKVPLTAGDSLTLIAAPEKLIKAANIILTPKEFGDAVVGDAVVDDTVVDDTVVDDAAVGDEVKSSAIYLHLTVKDRDGRMGTLFVNSSNIVFDDSSNDETVFSEVIDIASTKNAVQHSRDRTSIKLSDALKNIYQRSSVQINFNVVAATHGESVNEILGNGNAAVANPRFTLKQTPLSYLSASTPSGRQSSLELRVNNVLWEETPSLYRQSDEARVYQVNHEDDGSVILQLGDGVEGALLPTGQTNIRASYRKGTGVAGNLAKGTLTTLLSKPLGISEVINPEPATGGENPEALQQIRSNAPLTVLTMGRAVSIADYQHYAQAFAGIAKAHALWIGSGPSRGVFVTVAGIEGAAIPTNSATYAGLSEALRRYGDPLIPITIENYQTATFSLSLSIKVLDGVDSASVLAEVRSALHAHFSFSQRHFGQPVSRDEIVAVVHSIDQVQAVQITAFFKNASAAKKKVATIIPASLPVMSLTQAPAAAQLLTLSDDPIVLELLP